MSTASRLISGSAASWAQIAVTMISQLALVPIYLSHWNLTTYGIWLAIQSILGIITIIDLGHQEFLAYEFLRIGKADVLQLSQTLWSGVLVSLGLSTVQLLVIGAVIITGVLPHLLGATELLSFALVQNAGLVLLLQGATWLVCSSASGLFFRALSPFGYYPRMAWWTLANTVIWSVSSVTTVILGGDLLAVGLVGASSTVLLSILIYLDLFRLLRKEGLNYVRPSWRLGGYNFVQALALLGRVVLENVRQQGARLLLAPLAGAAGLAAFSTMRTGANVALQGLNTIVNPLMPELMRFLHQRDQDRCEAAFGTLWIVLVAIMAPATIILQAIVGPLYILWTRGRATYNPLLFASLSLAVLVYALAQPAMAIVRGNNLLKAQLQVSTLAATAMVGTICVLVPKIGILGGGLALLLAEVVATGGYRWAARRWLEQNNMTWPERSFLLATASVLLVTVAMLGVINFPQFNWYIVSVTLLLLLVNIWSYWQVLPKSATQRARQILITLPGVRILVAILNSLHTTQI